MPQNPNEKEKLSAENRQKTPLVSEKEKGESPLKKRKNILLYKRNFALFEIVILILFGVFLLTYPVFYFSKVNRFEKDSPHIFSKKEQKEKALPLVFKPIPPKAENSLVKDLGKTEKNPLLKEEKNESLLEEETQAPLNTDTPLPEGRGQFSFAKDESIPSLKEKETTPLSPTSTEQEATFRSTELMKTVFELKQDVKLLEEKMSRSSLAKKKDAESLFSLLLLKDKLKKGAPFNEELSLFSTLNQGNPVAEGLTKILTEKKPLTYKDLLRAYKKTYEVEYINSFIKKEDLYCIKKLKEIFFSAFKIRQVSVSNNDTSTRGLLNRAYLDLERGHIYQALDTLSLMKKPPKEFMDKAETYLVIQTYLDTLIKNALISLSEIQGGLEK
ncbi:MAG: hypothetical protein EOM53_02415 [Alphaproteobacteria bacterium]|nr:hypothetical protein [Alphaproteobacteria bacterium]